MWDNKIINLKEAITRVMGHNTMYKRWLDEFFTPKTLETVKVAFVEKNYENAHQAMHKLKGTSGNLAISKLFEQAFILDEMIKANTDFDELESEMEILEQFYNEAESMFLNNSHEVLSYKIPE